MLESLNEEITGFKPEQFLTANDLTSANTLAILKTLYDFTKNEEKNAESIAHLVRVATSAPHRVKSSSSKKKTKSQSINKFQLSRTELPLQTLIVHSFDSDQVWAELELQNALLSDTLISSFSKISAHNNRTQQSQQSEAADDDSSDSSSEDNRLRSATTDGSDDDDSEVEFEDLKSRKSKTKKASKGKKEEQKEFPKSVIDDKFFSLAQMDDYMARLEAAEEVGQNPESDIESDSDDDENERSHFPTAAPKAKDDPEEEEESHNYFYQDYFDPPLGAAAQKNGHPGPDEDDSEDDVDDDDAKDEDEGPSLLKTARARAAQFSLLQDADSKKVDVDDDEKPENPEDANASNFEKRRKKIDEGIELMEKEALEPKAWQFQGEVTADKRPQNSLLEQNLIFERMVRAAPEMTAEATFLQEDRIKQRAKDQAWDDVIRKIKPVDNPVEYKKRLVLDSEKSRVGLSQIYEEEYIKQKKAEDKEEQEEVTPEEQVQIEKDLKALFSKLDALSNFHYTPKPPSAEIRVVTNLPSIAIEEVAPVAVSDATLLAPQEIQDPALAEIKGKAERTDTDKKRERRIKKKKQHVKRISREEKARAKGITLQHVTYADKKLEKAKSKAQENEGHHNTKELKSSKAFFSKLQQEVQAQIKGTKGGLKRKNKDTSQLEAKKFKL